MPYYVSVLRQGTGGHFIKDLSFLRHSSSCILFSESCHRCQNIDNGSYLGEMDESDFFCLRARGELDSAAALLRTRRRRSSGSFMPPPRVKAGGNFSSEQKYGEGEMLRELVWRKVSLPACRCRGFRRERCTQWRQREERAAWRAGELGMMMRLRAGICLGFRRQCRERRSHNGWREHQMSVPAGFKKYFMRQPCIKLSPQLSMLSSNFRQKA